MVFTEEFTKIPYSLEYVTFIVAQTRDKAFSTLAVKNDPCINADRASKVD